MSSFAHLVDDHDEILRQSQAIVDMVSHGPADVDAVALDLACLSKLVRDHLASEDPMIYRTVVATKDTRHEAAAEQAAAVFERLKGDWEDYLRHWNARQIAAGWDTFVAETVQMLSRLVARVEWESAVLYSLAVHYCAMPPAPGHH